MAKAGARKERIRNSYYRNGKYWANKQAFKKAEKERIEKLQKASA